MRENKSFFKKIAEKFKGFFNKNKALPEGRGEWKNLPNKHKEFVSELQKNIMTDQPLYAENSIENAIQQYLYSYSTNLKNSTMNSKDKISYISLTELAGKSESGGQNYIAENEKMFDDLKQKGYILYDQANTFMHIRNQSFKNNYPQIEDINERIYLNPNRENVTELAKQILYRTGNNPIYLKILKDESIERGTTRNEKMVIYLAQEEMPQIVNTIVQISRDNPQLFKDTNYMNPFLKNIEGIMSYAPNPSSDKYKQINGNIVNVSKSYNSVLAKALEDSVQNSIRDLMPDGYNPKDFSKALDEMIEQKPAELINRMKEYLEVSQINNPILDIKGIPTRSERNNEER